MVLPNWVAELIRVAGNIAGGAAGGILLVHYFGKKLIEQNLAKDLERHKAELTQQTESLKTDMSIYAHQKTVIHSRVDSQRAEAIKIVYAAMIAWIQPTSRLITGTPVVNGTTSEAALFAIAHAEKAHQAGLALSDRLLENAIYFDTSTYTRLAKTVNKSTTLIAEFLAPIRQAQANSWELDDLASDIEISQQALDSFYSNQVQPLHTDIIVEFRRLLGSENTV